MPRLQVDQLVHLLETPVFTYLRLQLLQPERHAPLLRTLYGLLMLLPQTSTFYTLQARLQCVTALTLLQQQGGGVRTRTAEEGGGRADLGVLSRSIDLKASLERFRALQAAAR